MGWIGSEHRTPHLCALLGVVCVLTYAVLYFSGNRDFGTWQNVALLLAVGTQPELDAAR